MALCAQKPRLGIDPWPDAATTVEAETYIEQLQLERCDKSYFKSII